MIMSTINTEKDFVMFVWVQTVKKDIFGKAYRTDNIDRKRPYYDSLVRAGRKRARQEGKKQGEDRD